MPLRILSLTNLRASFHVPRGLLMQTAWSTVGYGIVQVIRFASTVILTRLLAPDLFGIMVLLLSLRMGIDLFADLGIGTAVTASPRTRDEVFYNTAWTMQLLRGVLLALIVLALQPTFQTVYDDKMLREVLPTLSLFVMITGMQSIAQPIAIKELRTKRISVWEVSHNAAGLVLTLGCVLYSPTVWGLVVGQLLTSAFAAAATYFILPDVKPRLILDRCSFLEIFSFGKWIFVSSIVYFLSTFLDRLVLGKLEALAMLGVYGVARTLAEVFSQFGSRMSTSIVFPKVANTDARGLVLRSRIGKRRLQFIALMLVGIATLIALAEPLISIMYDPRYIGAATALPWLAVAIWIGTLNSLLDSFALGVGKPQRSMVGNIAKLVALGCLLPIAISRAGIVGAAAASIASELVRYVVLSATLFRERLSFIRQDVAATGAFLALALLLHECGRLLLPAWFTLSPFAGWPN